VSGPYYSQGIAGGKGFGEARKLASGHEDRLEKNNSTQRHKGHEGEIKRKIY
jgi:hypothetical protein